MIEMTIGLPFFRSKFIGWLALESIARQKNINFEWELIIVEEQESETLGKEEIFNYKEKFEKIGCSKIRYFPLDRWIPLATKMQMIIEESDFSSKIIAFNSADYYSPPLRFASHYIAFKNNDIDWFRTTKTIYYEIATEKTILHDTELLKNPSDSCGRAISLSLCKKLPKAEKRGGVDGWLYTNCLNLTNNKMRIFVDKSNNWKYGLNTHGLNNISHHRRSRYFRRVEPPFTICTINIKETIPLDILQRLKDSKQFLKQHSKRLPK